MRNCPTCKGTGIAPETIQLECIGCQRRVAVTYTDSADLRAKCEEVRCADCRRAAA